LLAQREAFESEIAIRSGFHEGTRSIWRPPAPHVLMRRIMSPTGVKNYLSLGNGQVYAGDVVSELGIFGGCLFQRPTSRGGVPRILKNEVLGWSLKSKRPDVNEMSVVLGYGAFDSLRLVDGDEFVDMIHESDRQRAMIAESDL